jgi:hypothetical protein
VSGFEISPDDLSLFSTRPNPSETIFQALRAFEMTRAAGLSFRATEEIFR